MAPCSASSGPLLLPLSADREGETDAEGNDAFANKKVILQMAWGAFALCLEYLVSPLEEPTLRRLRR